jgi:uncharacterized membrane protein YdcZ (DUF606 family)
MALFGSTFSARPAPAALAGLPWWAWAGGAVQALTVFSVLVAAGASGAALFSALTVTGGTIPAVLLDHFGLLGFAQRDATLLRLAGCGLLVAGTVLVARGWPAIALGGEHPGRGSPATNNAWSRSSPATAGPERV